MKYKDIDEHYEINPLDFKAALHSANTTIANHTSRLLPVVLLYAGMALLNGYLLHRYLLSGPNTTTTFSIMPMLSIVVVMLVGIILYIYLMHAAQSPPPAVIDPSLFRQSLKKLGSVLLTQLAVLARIILYMLPVYIVMIIAVIGLAAMQVQETTMLIIMFVILLPPIAYLQIKYLFAMFSTVFLGVKGFTAANIAVRIFKRNRKPMLIFGFLFAVLPTIPLYIVPELIPGQGPYLITIVAFTLYALYALFVFTNAHLQAVRPRDQHVAAEN